MSTMKAVRVNGYGEIDSLIYETIEKPHPGAGEVLVQVKSAGVNPADFFLLKGYFKDFVSQVFPVTAGVEFSGVVAELGEGVSGFTPGDAVIGVTPMETGGAFAEYVIAKAESLGKKPASVSFDEGAAIPVSAFTAWQGLFPETGANLQPGQRILIQGAAGAVGTFSVQLAKWHGAEVIATCSTANVDYVKGLGADLVVDYTTQKLSEVVEGTVDSVYDLAGASAEDSSWSVVKDGGVFVSAVLAPSQEKAKARGVRANQIFGRGDGALLDKIADLVDQGVIKPVVSQVYTYEETGKALADVSKQHGHGKRIIRFA